VQFGTHRQKISKIVGVNFEGGGGKEIFLNPYIFPNFGHQKLKLYVPLELNEPHFHSEFCEPNPKNGAWKDDRRN